MLSIARSRAKADDACIFVTTRAWNALHVYAHVARSGDVDTKYPGTRIVRNKIRYDGSAFRKGVRGHALC